MRNVVYYVIFNVCSSGLCIWMEKQSI